MQPTTTGAWRPLLLINVLIALGAIIGSTARWALSGSVSGVVPSTFPLGTLLTNLAGCLLIGVVQPLLRAQNPQRRELLQPAITAGMLGSFTTFSTLSVETIQLLQAGHVGQTILYQIVSQMGGAVAVMLGLRLSRWLRWQRRGPA